MSSSLTAIIITYQRPDELAGAVANLLAQDPPPDEIVIYDDDPQGSGRQAAGVTHPRVRYICARENGGPAGARTRAAELCATDLLLFLDDDCRFAQTDTIARVREIFADPARALAAFLIKREATGTIVPRNYPGYTLRQVECPHDVSYFSAGGFAVRREVFLAAGGFDPILYHGEEELDLSLRLINRGWRLRYDPGVVVLHREAQAGKEAIRPAFRHIRNRLYLAAKHLPLPYLLSHFIIWGGFTFLNALRRRQLREYGRGVASMWSDGLWAEARRYRRANPMTREALAYLKQHDGRLRY